MQMTLQQAAKSSESVLIIEHKGEQTFWSASCYIKRGGSKDDRGDPSDHINRYWASLPMEKQDGIFQCYKEIYERMEEIYDSRYLIEQLMDPVRRLMDFHPLDQLGTWLAYKGGISIPPDIKQEFVVSDTKPIYKDKTYIVSEYRQLITMALALRAMIPVWGEFIVRTEAETGTEWKDYYAYQLLRKSHLMYSEPMTKLRVYVQRNIKRDNGNEEDRVDPIIIEGIGTENYPEWLLAVVLVRRVCAGDITGTNETSHLVKYIYNYVDQRHRNPESTSVGKQVKAKDFENPSASTENSASRIEAYKMTQDITTGDLQSLEYFMVNPYNVAKLLYPSIDEQLLAQFLAFNTVLEKEIIEVPQVVVTQWIMKPVISPRGLRRLTKRKMINAISIAQTVMWMEQRYEIAGLLSARSTDHTREIQLSSGDRTSNIPKDIHDKLTHHYPYTRLLSAKQKTKPINAAVAAINEVAAMFNRRDWELTLPDLYCTKVTGTPGTRRFGCPSNIKILLAELALRHCALQPRTEFQ